MNKGLKLALIGGGALVVAAVLVDVFVSPQRALSAAIMRDCIGIVKDNVRGAGAVSVISVVAIQPDPNKRKLEDFSRATRAVIERGEMTPSEPSVLVEFETSRGGSKALCEYHAKLWTRKGTYSGVSFKYAQVGLNPLSELELALASLKSFDVGHIDRLFSLVPIVGSEQKFYLD
ncbi:hypothetical protein M5G25_19190 [Pseudomonas sp. TNT2022 ID357]|uniref:Uncharacterized protein n=1 Tax=Pseudomonas idahonensis TaxID=2942628 RepID=A0ABT5Q887_9PSED|nr:hypothetical protein [Pseudomonas idahonensis]MDD1150408.1 hypothetical protein [Pseudomonas idahonensis]